MKDHSFQKNIVYTTEMIMIEHEDYILNHRIIYRALTEDL